MQYTQRGRLEWHPKDGDAKDYNVELGLVGTELLAARQQIQALQTQLVQANTTKPSVLQKVSDILSGRGSGS